MSLPPFSADLRQVLGQFATGVTVVGFEWGTERGGMTVNSFTSVSLEPPLILFCPALGTRFANAVKLADRFSVSILAQDQQELCWQFAGRGEPNPSAWVERDGVAVLEGCLAWLSCRVEAVHHHGDHLVVIGEVLHYQVQRKAPPLLFFRGQYPMLSEGAEEVPQ